TTNIPAPEQAMLPKCARCQSLGEPSSAEYWHIGEITTRFGSVMPPSWIGENNLRGGNRDPFLFKNFSQRLCKFDCTRLIAVQAHRVRGDRDALAVQADDDAFLDHAERLLHRRLRVLDHAAGLVARRERAVIRVAAVGEYLACDLDFLFFRFLHRYGI